MCDFLPPLTRNHGPRAAVIILLRPVLLRPAIPVWWDKCREFFLGAIGTGIVAAPIYGGAGVVDYTKCVVKDGVVTSDCPLGDYDVMAQVLVQAKNALITIGWSAIGSLAVYLLISLIVGLRVSPEAEREGLDIAEHGERAYNM